MNFSQALEHLKAGARIARSGWNGKGMFLVYVPGTVNCELRPFTPYHSALRESAKKHITIDAHVDLFTAQGTFQPGWTCSAADMLGEDWMVIQ